MGKRKKFKHNSSFLDSHQENIYHFSSRKNFDMQGTLADQIREKVLPKLANNFLSSSEYAIDIISKAFGGARICLKHADVEGYTLAHIRGFFSVLDFVDTVYVVVENKQKPFVKPHSLLVVKLNHRKHSIPVELFWKALPNEIKERFKGYGNFFVIYKALFAAYQRKLVPIKSL